MELHWSTSDLVALLLAVLLCWVAGMQRGRRRRAEEECDELRERLRERQATVEALRSTTLALRTRVDALYTSLPFQRKLAEWLESGTCLQAAEAALTLATARIGAPEGAVHWYCSAGFELLFATAGGASSLDDDQTVDACRVARRAVYSGELGPRYADDCDLAAPVFAADGTLVAVITLRGGSEVARAGWAATELGLIADWCRRGLSQPQRLQRAHARDREID